jgi:hypothetical protein
MTLDPIRNAATEAADFVAMVLKSMSDAQPFWPDQTADGSAGLLMPALAGIAAAVMVALALTIYFRTGYRSFRDMIRHGLGVAIALGLLAFAAYDMRHMAYLDKTSARPIEFDLRWQKTTERAHALVSEMDRHGRSPSDAHQG